MNDILESLIEVKIAEEEDFLKIKETLTRIGVASRKDKKLFQSCHIFHKQGKYYIVHFKEMFILDGKYSNFSDEDTGRRNKIIELLQDWGLLKVLNPEKIKSPLSPMSQIKILNHKEKGEWTLESKYNIGRKKK
ncbi:translation repressor protein [uncultured Caudovirales phage]|uniref:Translation repressor protein n=1 Tax=uncultured Caudovirales phage TaxID=2100421 RepID=A0A6J5NT25_9CAUD|nr:translation repressor protein [uncultured Caudovirales phage]